MLLKWINLLKDFQPKSSEHLSKYTTWKIGGPAEILIEAKSSVDLLNIIKIALENEIPFRILGNGSNILISDEGLPGLTIINNKSRNIQIQNNFEANSNEFLSEQESQQFNPYIPPRHTETGDKSFYSFEDLDYQETGKKVKVSFDSGVFLPYAIAWCLKQGFTGLQWFAGIPGTIGGSLYNNIHGGTRHFSDYFIQAQILIKKNTQYSLPKLKNHLIIEETSEYLIYNADFDFFDFGYDQSLLRKNPDIYIFNVDLNLFFETDIEKARYVAKEWTNRKRIQPKKSCGSVFQALPNALVEKFGFPTPSSGYVIDKILNLKGYSVGGAKISEKHANFIENIDKAKASEVLEIIKKIQITAKKQLGIDLYPEINFLGFKNLDLKLAESLD